VVSVVVATPAATGHAGGVTLMVDVAGTGYQIWFRASGNHRLEPSGDLELAVGLLVAMATDGILELDRAPSALLRRRATTIQDVLLSWYPELRRATLVAPMDESAPLPSGRGTLACFTGGVDSFYTVLEHAGTLDALLFVHGFDVPLDDQQTRTTVSEHLREAAREIGVGLIEVETNLRDLLDPYADWGQIAHGAALVAVASALTREFGRFVVPSSHSYRDLFPWGSHPVLDPLWSTPDLEVEHDGAGATRVDKIEAIAPAPAVRKHLRVCWQQGGGYNCGSCEKCLRTMVTLDLLGELTASETFPHDVDLERVSALPLRNESDASYLRENIELARRVGSARYMAVLEKAHRNYLAREEA